MSFISGLVVVAVIGAMVAMLLWLKRRPPAVSKQADFRIDVNALGAAGPPPAGARLEIRHVPVRLALLVVAPVGRGKQLPAGDLSEMADAIVPGLAGCLRAHATRVIRWPPQLSSQGFTQSFFGNVPLPGNRGQGTGWCAAAGKCERESGPFLAGMIFAAERPNSLGQFPVHGSHEWLDLLRIKDAS